MDWLNRAKQFLGGLFGGAQRTIGQISGNVARAVGQAEQNAARTAQQAVRSVVPKVPTIRLPQINIQAPRIQMPQAPKVDLAGLNRAFQQTQQQVGQFGKGLGEGANIGFKQFTGQPLTQREQQVVNIAKQSSPFAKSLVETTGNLGKYIQETNTRQQAVNQARLQQLKERPGQVLAEALSPLGAFSRSREVSQVYLGKDYVPKIKTTQAIDDISKELAKSPTAKIPGMGVVSDIVKPIVTETSKFLISAPTGSEEYSKGVKGVAEYINGLVTVASLVYTGGLSKQLATKGTAFLPTAAKLAPRLAASGAGQNVIQQLAEGKKLNEIDPKQIAAAAAAYTGLGIGIPGVSRGISAGIGKALGKGQAGIAVKAAQALPTDKNAPITVRTIPEKGALRAQGYTNVKVEFTPKPGQVTPTIPGRAIAETAPKAPKGQEALFNEARKYATPEEFVKAQGTSVYHGTNVNFESFDTKKIGTVKYADWGDGIYLTPSKSSADYYRGQAVGSDIIKNSKLGKELKAAEDDLKQYWKGNNYDTSNEDFWTAKAKVRDIVKKIEEESKKRGTIKEIVIDKNTKFYRHNVVDGQTDPNLAENLKLKEKGYGGIKIYGSSNSTVPEEIVIFDPKSIKTKQQLTDIWKQANKQGPQAIYENVPKSYLEPKTGKLPLGKKERGLIKSVKTSQEVSDDVKAVVSGEYTPKSNQVLINNADKFTKNPQKAYTAVNEQLSKPWGTVNDQEIANAITLAKKLDASGNKDAAGEVYDKLAQHLTQAGRDVQAASLLSRRTPEGLLFNARRTLKKAGIEITPNIQKELQTNIDLIKKTVIGSEQRNIAIAKMQKDLVKHIPQSKLDNIVSVWKAGLLSGAKTQGGSFLSNATFGTMKLASNPITAAVDKVMSVFTGKRTFALTGKGLASGGVEGAKKGIFTLKTGIDTRNFATGAAKFDQVAEINFKNKTVQAIIGTPSNWVFRGMSAADQPFYFAALKNSLYSQAIAEAKNQGLKGKALKDFLSNSLSNPSKTMLNVARNEADKAVLGFDTIMSRAVSAIHKSVETSNLSPVGKATANAIINFIAPFTRVPSAFLSRTLDYTPLGMTAQIFKAITSQIKTGTFDQRALAQAIGEGATGTGLIVLGAQLANADLLSGDYPKNDQKEQARWKAQGITPNSVKLGNTWVSLNYLGPLGLLFGAGKNFVDAQKEGGTITDVAAQTIGGFGSGLLQQSFLQGLNGFTQAVNDPTKYGQYFRSFAGSVVPSWINDIANITDQFKRQANTPLEAAMARIPGLRQNLPVQVDVFGRQLETGGIQSINPFKPSPSVQTPLTNELDRLKATDKENNVWPTPFDNKDFFGKDTSVTKEQLQQIQGEVGPLIEKRWSELINTPTYNNASDSQKAKILKNAKDAVIELYKKNNARKYGQTYVATKNLNTQEKYQNALDKYNQDKALGNISTFEDVTRQKELGKLKVGSSYSNDVLDIYDLSGKQIKALMDQKAISQDLWNQVIAYGDALVAAGIDSKNKFKDKYGNIYLPGTKETGGGKGTRKTKISLRKPRISRIRVAAPKGTRKISFKVPTPTKARKSIKIKTG